MDETDLEPQEKILIDEDLHVEDTGHKVVDWTLRNLLRPINGDPNTYWKEAEMSPMLGTNLYLTHLFPLLVNPQTIQAVYTGTTMTKIKYFSCKNRVLIYSMKK